MTQLTETQSYLVLVGLVLLSIGVYGILLDGILDMLGKEPKSTRRTLKRNL